MNITPEIVENLLDTLVTPMFSEYIKSYGVIVRKSYKGDSIIVRVFLNGAETPPLDNDEYYVIRGRIDTSVKQVLKYLSPFSTDINFSIID